MDYRPPKTSEDILAQAERITIRLSDKAFEHVINLEAGLATKTLERIKFVFAVTRRMLMEL